MCLILTLNRSYKISFSLLCSWITINLYRRHRRRVLIRINWEVNPTKYKSLEKKESLQLQQEARGALPDVGAQRGL